MPAPRGRRPGTSGRRDSSGVSGLDEILHGGFPQGHFYLVEGEPGAGKTTLGLQFLMEGARQGGRALYITMSESEYELRKIAGSHGWSLDGVTIYQYAPQGTDLSPEEQYSVFHPSDVEFQDTTQEILREVKRINPARVVLDSLSEIRLLARDPLRYRRQVLALRQYFSTRDCTVLLLDDRTSSVHDIQLESIAHGVIFLETVPRDYGKTRRRLQISKLRGSAYREGYQDFVIRKGGLTIFPRLITGEEPGRVPKGVAKSGIDGLDALWEGGLDRGTSALFIGPAGSGKSSLAFAYAIQAARKGEVSAAFLFEESVSSACERSASLGMDASSFIDSGKFHVRKIDPSDLSPGEFIDQVRLAVEKLHAKVIVIDSLNGLLQAMPNEETLTVQLHQMLAFLNNSGIVTIVVLSQAGLVSTQQDSPVDLSYLADNVLLFRYFETDGRVRKALSVVKKRSGDHEDSIRELNFSKGRISLGPPLTEFRGVLTGVPIYVGSTGKFKDKRAAVS
ncbi:MAG TPA: ATPase domain-containing protein [Terriglobia bacterium]|nr:ATPase domain-containing protein [Terriglobia bacterium]